MSKIALFCGILSVLGACHYKPDNIVEEIAEEIIEAKTGMDIDLSPGSPEK